jgi:hypothetical protein
MAVKKLKPGEEPGTRPNPTGKQSQAEIKRSKTDGKPETKGGADGSAAGGGIAAGRAR